MIRKGWLSLLTAIVILSGLPQAHASAHPLQIAGRIIDALPPLAIQATATDPLYSRQWQLNRIAIPRAWDVSTGSPALIAVIDTGIMMGHEDLTGKIWVNSDEIPGNGVDDDHNGYIDDYNGYNFVDNNSDITDLHGHGTGIASIIAATTNNGKGIAGISWQSVIMPVKALNSGGGGDYEDVALAIRYAADNGAKIINMSFGAQSSVSSLDSAVSYALAKGVIIVAAVGNGSENYIYYPAAYPSVIAVSSTDRNDSISSFANRGPGVDVVAPGELVLMANNSSSTSYVEASGTSFSAAEVSGVAALILARYPNLNSAQMEAVLKGTADPMGDSNIYGAGSVNAYKAVTYQPLQLSAQTTITTNHSPANGLATVNFSTKITDQFGNPQSNQTITGTISGSNNILGSTLLTANQSVTLGSTDSSGTLNFGFSSTTAEAKTVTLYQGSTVVGTVSNLTFAPPTSPKYTMAWLGQSPYPALDANQTATLWVDVKNTGNMTWVSDPAQSGAKGQIYLGTDRPLDRTSTMHDASWLSANRVTRMAPDVVRPNETARFSFTIKPSTNGNFREYFRPVVEYITWLNDLGIYWDVKVGGATALTPYSADLVSQNPTLTLARGQTGYLTVTVRNSGSTTWSSATGTGQVKLGTAIPRDRASAFVTPIWLSPNRAVAIPTNVSPNSTLTITFPVKAPETAGNYTESFQLVSEYVTWFGPTFTWNIAVN